MGKLWLYQIIAVTDIIKSSVKYVLFSSDADKLTCSKRNECVGFFPKKEKVCEWRGWLFFYNGDGCGWEDGDYFL